MKNLTRKEKRMWLKALGIAKILFEEEGYHTRYLESIEQLLMEVEECPATKCG